VGVLAVHLLLGIGVWRLEPWQERGRVDATQRPLAVVIYPAVRAGPAAAVAEQAPAPAAAPRRSAVARSRDANAIQVPTAAALPALPPVFAPQPAPADTAALPAPAASRPLNLELPRDAQAAWRRRNPALDDPRSNSAKLSFEQRIVAALGGDDRIVEEQLADGSVRFRRGTGCIIARPNRAQVLDPFNQSFSPKPRPVEAC
jgi:hypothetical protein